MNQKRLKKRMTSNGTPVALLLADFALLLFGNAQLLYLIQLYRRKGNPLTLFFIVSGLTMDVCLVMTIAGLGFGHGNSLTITKQLTVLFCIGSLVYTMFIFQRCTTFDLMFPDWFISRWKLFVVLSVLFSAMTLWPCYVFAFDQQLELSNPLILKVELIGWALWLTYIVLLDLFLFAYSFKFVMELVKTFSANEGKSWNTCQEVTRLLSPLFFLTATLIVDVLYLAMAYTICIETRHPNVIEANALTVLFLAHINLGFAYLILLGKLITSQNHKSYHNLGNSFVPSPHAETLLHPSTHA
jgi:hypothetical protein